MAGTGPISANLSVQAYRFIVMAGRGPAIHVFLTGHFHWPLIDMPSTAPLRACKTVVDGRATPGHDDGVRTCPLKLAPRGTGPAMTAEGRVFARNHA